jgi:large subunit ribosomal protein L21
MFAVIRTGGKQYKVAPDDVIAIERITGEPGAEIELGEVLMLGDGKSLTMGTPLVDGARVAATVLDQGKGEKVLIFKKKRRQGYHRTRGHRQFQTVLRITEILAAGQSRSAAAAPAKRKKQAAAAEGAEEATAAAPKRRTRKKTEEKD